LEALGAIVLQVDDDSALIVVTGFQLELLAKRRFEPYETVQVSELLGDSASLASIAAQQFPQLITAPAADSDNDGLTNLEETWWATDPNNPDTDGDTHKDGAEVASILAWHPLQGPPFIKWRQPDGSSLLDGDTDCVPDLAETFAVGSNVDRESTDGDKFDDGQELFGITRYPGYGALPRPEDTFITANMPGWVDPPGNHIFVAAYPQVSVHVAADSIQVELVTTVTTGESHQVGESFTYGVAKTQGTSTSVGETESHTYNTWQEVSNSVADEWERTHYEGTVKSDSYQYSRGYTQGYAHGNEYGKSYEEAYGVQASANCEVGLTNASCGVEVGVSYEETYGYSAATNESWENQNSYGRTSGLEVSIESSNSIGYRHVHETATSRGAGYEVGHATTVERSSYEEATISNDHTIATAQEWSTATAVDTQHAADLFFIYEVSNSGTDSAREISGVVFNIYIGSTMRTYHASQQDIGVLRNFYPGESHVYSSSPIPLSLEQLRLIDEGARIHVAVEDYGYGDDEQFYQNAWTQSVLVEVDDGVEDDAAEVDPYMIATWGEETYQQVIGRYFAIREHDNGNLLAISTPEYNTNHQIASVVTHTVSSQSWWDIFLEDENSASGSFKDEPAWPETRAFLRFNQDTDRDRYSNRTESQIGTDPNDPYSHPAPILVAGHRKQREGNQVTVTMSFLNLGNENASGVEAVMYAPDDTVSIGNNLIGGGGRIRAGSKVTLGPTFSQPVLQPGNWSGDAQPRLAGLYTGTNKKTYTFAVNATGQVGISPGLTAGWNDGHGHNGTLDIGDDYSPPSPLNLTEGVQVVFSSGSVQAGNSFTSAVQLPLDTMTYTISTEPYTEPVIVVSYNDAQGNHRFITPVELSNLDADLTPYAGEMLYESALEIRPLRSFQSNGENITEYTYYHPHTEDIADAHLFVEMATISGTIVSETVITPTISRTVNPYRFQWNTGIFTVPFQSGERYKIVAILTDREGSIIDTDVMQFEDFGTNLEKRVFNRTIATAGGPASSVSYQLNGTLGQGWNTGVRQSANYQLFSGYWSGWVATPNRPPYEPSNPEPANGAIDVATNQALIWQSGDPDNDLVTYTVAFGTSNPPPFAGITTLNHYKPNLTTNVTYYWCITATDGTNTVVGPVWHFTTASSIAPNNPPYLPSDPSPADGASNVLISQRLSWQGGDPDYDPVTYLVALGTTNPPPHATTTALTVYSPTLVADTTYYWRITASDGVSNTVGLVWSFATTQKRLYLPAILKSS